MSPTIRTSKDDANKLQGRTVDILVGDGHEAFSVHEKLIRDSSSFFDKAMAGEWKESLQRTFQLPDDEPRIFGLYIHWLYYGTLPVFCDEPGLPGNAEYVDLVKAYVLGDKFLDFKFQNATIDAIIEKTDSKSQDRSRWFPVGEPIEYAYTNTCESALIRKLLVDLYVHNGFSGWLHDWGEPAHLPQPFLLELASELLDRRVGSEKSPESSDYHIHDSTDGKDKT
ncbi:unnamed protein product [Penicillium glandicola]